MRDYVELVNAKEDENGNLQESSDRTNLWAWKHPHKAEGTVTYTKQEGGVVFDDVDFGYSDNKIVLHNISLYAKPGQKIAFGRSYRRRKDYDHEPDQPVL